VFPTKYALKNNIRIIYYFNIYNYAMVQNFPMNVIRHSGWRREAPETRNPSVSSRWIAGLSDVMPGLDPGTGNDDSRYVIA
jgi:hypothetical protein